MEEPAGGSGGEWWQNSGLLAVQWTMPTMLPAEEGEHSCLSGDSPPSLPSVMIWDRVQKVLSVKVYYHGIP